MWAVWPKNWITYLPLKCVLDIRLVSHRWWRWWHDGIVVLLWKCSVCWCMYGITYEGSSLVVSEHTINDSMWVKNLASCIVLSAGTLCPAPLGGSGERWFLSRHLCNDSYIWYIETGMFFTPPPTATVQVVECSDMSCLKWKSQSVGDV